VKILDMGRTERSERDELNVVAALCEVVGPLGNVDASEINKAQNAKRTIVLCVGARHRRFVLLATQRHLLVGMS
jgi:hypothetical protein